MRFLTGGVVVACCALGAAQPAVGAEASRFGGVSENGKVVVVTSNQLTPADTDTSEDVYLVDGSTTTLLSVGASGGNGAFDVDVAGSGAISDDGSTVVFRTREQLTADDLDSFDDLYVWRNAGDWPPNSRGVTRLLSHGPSGGDSEQEYVAELRGMSGDGRSIFFRTRESLTPNDNEDHLDVYERWGGYAYTSLVSENTGPYDADLVAISPDGATRLITTRASLAIEDVNTAEDTYQRVGYGQPKLVTTGSLDAASSENDIVSGWSTDLSYVFFNTRGKMEPPDADDALDGYRRGPNGTELMTIGPNDLLSRSTAQVYGGTDLGWLVWLMAKNRLTSEDHDRGSDIYLWDRGTLKLVSAGPAGGSSGQDPQMDFIGRGAANGWVAVFETPERLVWDDHDDKVDLYDWAGTGPRLLTGDASVGGGAFDVHYGAADDPAGAVAFTTAEQLTPDDTDSAEDVYVHDSGGLTLVSTGPAGGNGAVDAHFAGIDRGRFSLGEGRVWFETEEALVTDDTNGESDLYEWTPDGVRLLAPE
jgi:hypothetical protein